MRNCRPLGRTITPFFSLLSSRYLRLASTPAHRPPASLGRWWGRWRARPAPVRAIPSCPSGRPGQTQKLPCYASCHTPNATPACRAGPSARTGFAIVASGLPHPKPLLEPETGGNHAEFDRQINEDRQAAGHDQGAAGLIDDPHGLFVDRVWNRPINVVRASHQPVATRHHPGDHKTGIVIGARAAGQARPGRRT